MEGSVHTRSLTQHLRAHPLSKWQFGSALPDLPKEIFHTWPEFPLQEPRESSWGGIFSQAPRRLGRGLSPSLPQASLAEKKAMIWPPEEEEAGKKPSYLQPLD